MDPLTLGLLGGTSLVSAGLGFLGSQNQANASREASNQQAQMQAMALQAQMIQNQRNQDNIAPFLATGTGAANQLTQQLPSLTQPFQPTQQFLENTPGYQFSLSQGLKGVQNSAAARGLGVSGAAMKGAANYATGLADNTLKTQYDIFSGNQNNIYNKLYGTAALGSNAAVGAGTLGQANANSQSSMFGNIGNAQAGGILGSAAAQNQGLGSISGGLNNLTSMYYMNNLLNPGGGGGLFGGGQTAGSGVLGQGSSLYNQAVADPSMIYAPSLGYS